MNVNGFYKLSALEVFDTLNTKETMGIRVANDGYWKAFKSPNNDMKEFRQKLKKEGIVFDFRAV